jgi:phospholipase/carboxylesterase
MSQGEIGLTLLDTVEVETGPQPRSTVIWLHGLGADGHDFEAVVPDLVRPGERALRFVLPHAPKRPVTINGGMSCRAWYDIVGFERHIAQDERGIRASAADILELIRRENERGVSTDRIVLAGFSQGGAMALFTGTRATEKLAGIIGLSCYMVLGSTLAAEHSAVNQTTPIFVAHGTRDPVVDVRLGDEARRLLEEAGYSVTWHSYSIPHSVSPEELTHVAAWLRRVL